MSLNQRQLLDRLATKYLAKHLIDSGQLHVPDNHDQIRKEAISKLLEMFDPKLKNLQEGECIILQVQVDIIGKDGEVRGGKGSERNMPEYIEWRTAVYKRDDYRCQECGKGGQLNAHHIKEWALHPESRFDVNNGITLCEDCHIEKHPHLKFMRKLRESDGK